MSYWEFKPKDLSNCPPDYQNRVPGCALSHTPAVAAVLASLGIDRCTPNTVGPSVFSSLCSTDSHIITGLRACRLAIGQSLTCPVALAQASDRMTLDATLESGDPSVSKGEYFFPKLRMPGSAKELLTMDIGPVTPHFRALWTMLISQVKDLINAFSSATCDLEQIIKDPSLAPRVDMLNFLVEIITYSEAFHRLQAPTFTNSVGVLDVIIQSTRSRMLRGLNERPQLNERFFTPQTVTEKGVAVTTYTPHIDRELKSIYVNLIRPNTAIVLANKTEERGAFTAPTRPLLRIAPICNLPTAGAEPYDNVASSGRRMAIQWAAQNNTRSDQTQNQNQPDPTQMKQEIKGLAASLAAGGTTSA